MIDFDKYTKLSGREENWEGSSHWAIPVFIGAVVCSFVAPAIAVILWIIFMIGLIVSIVND